VIAITFWSFFGSQASEGLCANVAAPLVALATSQGSQRSPRSL